MDQSQTDPRVGVVLEGRYQVTSRLAEGSMGVVYRGERVRLGRPVAIKFLRASFAADSQFVQRFEREARAMSRLGHPHCVSVIDFGVAASSPYVVMEYVTGTTLAELLERGRLPLARAVAIMRQVLAGLAHAHGQGIIHRDLKAANVMLTEATGTGDHARLLDFGLAKLLDHLPSDVSSSHVVVGTPSYMSPEQSLGEVVDPRSDVYSAGVLLFELLTGEKPFRAEETYELLRKHRDSKPPSLAQLCSGVEFPAELERIVARALEKDPDDRFQSAIEMADALEPIARPPGRGRGDRLAALAYAPTESFAAARAPRSLRGFLVVLLLLLVAAGVAYARFSDVLERPERATPTRPAAPASPAPDLAPPPVPAEYPALDLVAAAAPDPMLQDAGAGPLARPGPADDDDLADPIQMDEMVLGEDDGGEESLPAEEREEPVAAVPEEESEPSVEDAPAEDATPVPARREVKTIADAKRLIAQGRRDEAIRGLRKLQREIPKSAYVPYLLGNLYFEKKWWKDGILAYRAAIKNNKIYRKKAILNQNLIRALGSKTTKGKAIWTFEHYVGRAAVPHLRKAAKADKNPTVRQRASWLASKLAKSRW